jgi:hypothetical protein
VRDGSPLLARLYHCFHTEITPPDWSLSVSVACALALGDRLHLDPDARRVGIDPWAYGIISQNIRTGYLHRKISVEADVPDEWEKS